MVSAATLAAVSASKAGIFPAVEMATSADPVVRAVALTAAHGTPASITDTAIIITIAAAAIGQDTPTTTQGITMAGLTAMTAIGSITERS